jgi:hypothetical protein
MMADMGRQRVYRFPNTSTLDARRCVVIRFARRFDHAREIQIDDTVIMIATSGGAFPSFPVWLHVYLPYPMG